MKNIILPALILFGGVFIARSQTYENIGVLQPFPTEKPRKVSKLTRGNLEYVDLSEVDFEIKVEPVKLPGPTSGFALSITIPNRELVFPDESPEAYLSILGRLTSGSSKSGSGFEERLLVKLSQSEKENAMKNSGVFRKVFELAPGKYKIDVLVRDNRSGNKGIRSVKFEIPIS